MKKDKSKKLKLKVGNITTEPVDECITKIKVELLKTYLPFYSSILSKMKIYYYTTDDSNSYQNVVIKQGVIYVDKRLKKEIKILLFYLLLTVNYVSYMSLIEKVINKRVGKAAAYLLSAAHWIFVYPKREGYKVPKYFYDYLNINPDDLKRYANKSFLDIYNHLIKNEIDIEKLPLEDDPIKTEVVKEVLLRSNVSSDGYSTYSIPVDLYEIIMSRGASKVNWNRVLINYIFEKFKKKKTYAKFNRRMLSKGLYLPGIKDDSSLKKLIIYIDTSGSVLRSYIEQVFNEMQSLLRSRIVKSLLIYCFDVKLYEPIEVEVDTSFDSIKIHGGGGTYIDPVMDSIIMEHTKKDVFVIFTDMHFNHSRIEDMINNKAVTHLNSNLIWVTDNKHYNQKNIGKIIKI